MSEKTASDYRSDLHDSYIEVAGHIIQLMLCPSDDVLRKVNESVAKLIARLDALNLFHQREKHQATSQEDLPDKRIIWVNPIKPKKVDLFKVVEWLEDRFREQRSWPIKDLVYLAKMHGITFNQLCKNDAVLALPIRKKKEYNANGELLGWSWTAIDPTWPPEKKVDSIQRGGQERG